MSGFDFTFDCSIFLFGSENGGYLLTDDHSLCLWTDADAASIFVNCSGEGRPYLGGLSLVEIETDNDLLALLTEAQQAGILKVAVDLASADQTTVRMLHVVDLLDMLRERIAET